MGTTSDLLDAHGCEYVSENLEHAAVVAVSGDLSWRTVKGLHETIAAVCNRGKLLIDLTQVTTMDSAGTGALVVTYLCERNAGRGIAFVAHGSVASILRNVGISGVIPVFETRRAAEGWLALPRADHRRSEGGD